MVPRAEVLGHPACIGKLVEAILAEADGESADGLAAMASPI